MNSEPPELDGTYMASPQIPDAVDEAEAGLYPAETVSSPEQTTSSLLPPFGTSHQFQQGAESTDVPSTDGTATPGRPPLRRDQSLPPPSQPPLPAPPQPPHEVGNPTDSLSLAQLQNLVHGMPKKEPTPYAFLYQDAATLPEELEEWLSYSGQPDDQGMLKNLLATFEHFWELSSGYTGTDGSVYEAGGIDWIRSDVNKRHEFILAQLTGVGSSDLGIRVRSLRVLAYLVLGCWYETAGLEFGEPGESRQSEGDQGDLNFSLDAPSAKREENHGKSAVQLEWIVKNVGTLFETDGVEVLYSAFRKCCLRQCSVDANDHEPSAWQKEIERQEIWCTFTILYVILEVARAAKSDEQKLAFRAQILVLQPSPLVFLSDVIDKLRWDDTIETIPLHRTLLLTWKTVLVTFGGLDEVDKVKRSFGDGIDDENLRGQPIITASPLDYHLFRQEISSKYPAYNPPPPLFPLEPDHNSILPPLKINPSKLADPNFPGPSNPANGASILHQPVHIATPAPSPPPSPAGPGGKGGKKQNYQTNQMFPFLYPPLDESSNNLGGKGTTGLQDVLAGRKWEGSDIPASILEAAELFSKRMRATRAMKQLWEERVEFIKYERGYRGLDGEDKNKEDEIEKLDLDISLDDPDHVVDGFIDEEEKKPAEEKTEEPEKPRVHDGSIEDRLDTVEDFYQQGLPRLQSLTLVLLKVILANVTALITQSTSHNGLQSAFQENQNGTTNHKQDGMTNGHNGEKQPSALEELDAVRTQEISAKAVSGILILLLKWFKASHILKFEYLTQLLVDANYIPLILKLMQTQEVERIVNYRCEKEDLNLFNLCLAISRHGASQPQAPDSPESEDDCAPPPIRRHREDHQPSNTSPSSQPASQNQPPEVDELGIPTSELPSEPITTFSWRNFFSSINFLRILQKVCKNKAHRNLLLVSYKSSTFLKKALKVPQPELRLYTLKLFKNQVPYCGRKWRQSNMRVITACYLHVRPELRDEWLAGGDVDGEVEGSVPMEVGLRSLTHWFNLRWYREQMGEGGEKINEEVDWFRKELEGLNPGGVGWGFGDESSVDEEWEGMAPEGW
ncbi:hypothetical protein K402DRAFT_389582 [Aulographum hederae CBS 113979]|uniref:N1221-domain-containing protein n=1 Tax=Aulographum hederae CBS 113979 TaxID=1176131 RepID=A0A6G1HCJ8_9PEZI|nr:hypothetical protein K402DRAFT_389582 [Aulographum hederae CBS 113979]